MLVRISAAVLRPHWEVVLDARVSHLLFEYVLFVEKKYLSSYMNPKGSDRAKFSQGTCVQTKVTNKSIPTPSLRLAFGSTQGQVLSKRRNSDLRTTSDASPTD
jgi:hypothetical protein